MRRAASAGRVTLSQLTTSTFEDVREAAPTSAKCLQL